MGVSGIGDYSVRMNLPAASGGVSCKRCIISEIRSARKFIICGVTTIFL
jgi:hypothetical protein